MAQLRGNSIIHLTPTNIQLPTRTQEPFRWMMTIWAHRVLSEGRFQGTEQNQLSPR
uniref:Uncharacterized protein n=1 Tax=Rhizophora mucronata TaxID=61149 RepID=A0A2P2Q417_RHIMU